MQSTHHLHRRHPPHPLPLPLHLPRRRRRLLLQRILNPLCPSCGRRRYPAESVTKCVFSALSKKRNRKSFWIYTSRNKKIWSSNLTKTSLVWFTYLVVLLLQLGSLLLIRLLVLCGWAVPHLAQLLCCVPNGESRIIAFYLGAKVSTEEEECRPVGGRRMCQWLMNYDLLCT